MALFKPPCETNATESTGKLRTARWLFVYWFPVLMGTGRQDQRAGNTENDTHYVWIVCTVGKRALCFTENRAKAWSQIIFTLKAQCRIW